MNQAASRLADRKELQGAVQNERLSGAQGSGSMEVILAESGLAVARSFSLEDVRVCQSDCLTTAEQVMPD